MGSIAREPEVLAGLDPASDFISCVYTTKSTKSVGEKAAVVHGSLSKITRPLAKGIGVLDHHMSSFLQP